MSAASAPLEKPRLRFRLRREHGLLLLFIVVTTLLCRYVDGFADPRNLVQLLRDRSRIGVLAAGMTLVILTGGIDLSVGSIVGLSAVSMGLVWKLTGSPLLALGTSFLVGAACGAFNGVLVSAGRVPPLIVTLATLSVFRGLAYAIAGSDSFGRFPPLILSWSQYNFLGLPAPFALVVGLIVALAIYLARTDGGRAVYAAGANATAARLSGVPVNRILFRLYLTSGLLAAVAAVLYAGYNNTVRGDVGNGDELDAITMVVLGGTSVAGGEGSMAGTALGFLTLVFIRNGMTLLTQVKIGSWVIPLPTEAHGVVVAGLLIGALLLDASFRRRAAS